MPNLLQHLQRRCGPFLPPFPPTHRVFYGSFTSCDMLYELQFMDVDAVLRDVTRAASTSSYVNIVPAFSCASS